MKKTIFLFMTLFCLFSERGKAQITLHPEAGVSFLPFKSSNGIVGNNKINRIDLLFGISAELPFNKDWFLKTRFSFTDRKNIELSYSSYFIAFYEMYNHSDLNIDLTLKKKIFGAIDLGAGPSIIKTFEKLNSHHYWYNGDVNYYYKNFGNIYFALNFGASWVLKRFKINFSYVRLFRNNDFIRYYSGNQRVTGKNRFDLTVSYHLLGGKKR